ncbi:MAG TPA: dipeptide ABC transporter ATP-binding protein [Streptosporangiaceae bacterium]|nr:dipeptide ABC transporter ATP-binding protein [Streptosporangiaceae bacterium]
MAGAASAAGQSGALLEVQDLNVRFDTADGTLHAVRGTSFEVRTGETLGIVGESGSGKSVTAQALLGLVPGADVTGHAWFEGHDLLAMNDAQLREIRGQRISMVFQDPLTSLHPLYKLGWQLTEAMRAHGTVSRAAASRRAVELLGMVGIPRPAERLDDYPHQFSGGMRQRVMIAMALALDPALIIADEPTTALDATVQAQVLELLVKLQGELGTSLVLITHDLGVVADLADHVMVMYSGAPVEQADRRAAYYEAHHPYTRGLLESIPVAGDTGRLRPIPGQPPSMLAEPPGCSFRPRCRFALARCATDAPPLHPVGASPGHQSACWLPDSAAGAVARRVPVPVEISAAPPREDAGSEPPLLELTDIVKHFPLRSGSLVSREHRFVHAVDGISLAIRDGETLGLVGETGCGKSTLARCIARLQPVTGGKIVFDGQDITGLGARDLRAVRREVQMVFQDPYGSLNPRRRIGAIVGEPLAVHGLERGARRRDRVQELMAMVGLNPEHYNRYPAEFSGGQRQRAGIARALAVSPKLLICDEPVSALDVSVQAQVINLLEDLQAKLDLTCIFISHDLGVVEHVSDRVAVMYLGQIVELASAEALYREPRHPYAAALLSAASVTDPDLARQRQRLTIEGDIPSPVDPPSGCRFHPRCPRAQDLCRVEAPLLVPAPADAGHFTACHFPIEPPAAVQAAREPLVLATATSPAGAGTSPADTSPELAALVVPPADELPGNPPADPGAGPGTGGIEGRGPWRLAWDRLRHDPLAVTAASFILLLILVAIFAPAFAHLVGHGLNQQNDTAGLTAAGLPRAPSSAYWLGTDDLGRDVFVRTIYGARISLVVGIVASVSAVIIGTTIGLAAGFLGGFVDSVLSRLMDLVLSFPFLLAAIALVSVVGPSLTVIIVVIALFSWAAVGRIVRGLAMSIKEKEYTEAARSAGAGSLRIMFVEVLPNLTAPLIVYTTLLIPAAISFEAVLSFLGLGIVPPTPSWGDMLAEAVGYYQVAWWFIAFPGLALLATTLAFNLLGDALRDALDPRGERLIASMRRRGKRRPRRAAAAGALAGGTSPGPDGLPAARTELR